MRAKALIVVLVTLAALAGCIGGSDDPAEPQSEPGLEEDAEPGEEQDEQGDEEANVPTEIPAPEWERGDWFTYEIEHALGPAAEVTLVVTEVTSSSYTLGWTDPDTALPTLIYHLPPAGEIDRNDLGWWVHGETNNLLEFPLEDGKSWTTTFSGEEYAFEASFVEGQDGVTVDLEGGASEGGGAIEATYDPEVGFFTSLERTFEEDGPGSPSVTLTDYCAIENLPEDTAYEPTFVDLLNEAVLGPSVEEPRPPIGDPVGQYSVPDDVDRLLVAGFFGSDEGHYSWSTTGPSGGTYGGQDTNGPGDDSMTFTYYDLADPEPGSWSYTATATGPGLIILEAMGVSLEEVTFDAANG